MNEPCKYHPTKIAQWYCNNCKVNFCEDCTQNNETSLGSPKCTLCLSRLNSLSIAHKIDPLWNKLPQLLATPLTTNLLIGLLIFSLLLALTPIGFFGLVALFILSILIVELQFDVMEKTASGETSQFNWRVYMIFNNKKTLLKLLAVYGLSYLIIQKISIYQTEVGALLTILLIAALPASLMILMMEKNMPAMLNPKKIGYIVKLLGANYWLLYTILLSSALLCYYTRSQMTDGKFVILWLFYFAILYLITCFSLISGYLIFQHHFELNFSFNRQALVKTQSAPNAKRQKDHKSDRLPEVNVLIQEGRFEDAQTLLLSLLKQNQLDRAVNYKANEKLILLYAIQDKTIPMNALANQYFSALFAANKSKLAADFCVDLTRREIYLQWNSTERLIEVCRHMTNATQAPFAIEMIKAQLKHQPYPEGWRALYLFLAKLVTEYSSNHDDAVFYLKQIIQKGDDGDDAIKAARDYLNILTQPGAQDQPNENL